MKLTSLNNTIFHCSFYECHKQAWGQNSNWFGYKNNPRSSNAFVLIRSNMKMEFCLNNGRRLVAQKGDVVFIPKGICYTVAFFNTGDQYDSYTINFLLSDENGNEIIIDEEMQIYKNSFSGSLLYCVEEFFKAYLCRENNTIKTIAQFYTFLDSVLTSIGGDSQYYYPIKTGVELLIHEWNKNTKIDYYALQCKIDKSYFYKLFKMWSGISPNQYRNMLRITASKDLLLHTNLTIAKIAQKIGFDDQYYFSRLFKKEVGLSPLQYRKANSSARIIDTL